MPLWLIFHPAGTFEDAASKQSFAEDITKMYTGFGLPAFYAVTNFIKLAPEDLYVGGKQKTNKPFIRVVINHVAHNMPNDEVVYKRATSRIDEVLKPHVYDRGYESEFHVGETERGLWKINGMIPPPSKSEEEKLWGKANRAVPCLGILVEEKKANWDTLVKDALPAFHIKDKILQNYATITDLLCHRAGISWAENLIIGTENNVLISREDAMKYFNSQTRLQPFRSQLSYSNIGFEIAGKVIESLSGESYFDFVTTRMLDPLGMDRTFLKTPPSNVDNVAACYNALDDAIIA